MARTTIFNRSLEAQMLTGIHSTASSNVYNLFVNIKQETPNSTEGDDGGDNENFDLQSQLCNPIDPKDINFMHPTHITVDNAEKNLESNLDSSRTRQRCTVISEELIENNENHCNRLGSETIELLQNSIRTDHYPPQSSELTTCSRLNEAKQATHHTCKICDSNFEDLSYLKMYRAKFFSSGYHQCTICNSYYDNEVQFLLHKLMKHEKSVLASKCSEPKPPSKRPNAVQNKIKKKNSINNDVTEITTFERSSKQCIQCKDGIKSTPQFTSYSEALHGTRFKYLRVSLVKLDTMIDLLELNKPHNSKNSETCIPEEQQQSSFLCCICGQTLTSQFLLASHYLACHIPYPSQRCCICFLEFRNRRELCSHIFIHCQEHNADIRSEQNIQPGYTICEKIPPSTADTSCSCKAFDSSPSRSDNLILNLMLNEKGILNNPATSTSLVFDSDKIERSDVSMAKSTDLKSSKNVVTPRTRKFPLTFKCKICNYACRRPNHLDHHLLIAHAKRCNKEKYSSDRCKSRSRIERYQRFEHSSKKLHSCSGVANRELERITNNSKKSKLRDISRLSNANGGLEIPFLRIKHGTKKIYGCKWCKFKSLLVETLKCHIIRNHSRRDWRLIQPDYKCKTCKLKFHNLRSLKSHQKRHAANGNEMCQICGIRFAWKDLLLMHTRSAHNIKTAVRYKLRCDVCNEGFHSKKYLRIHCTHFHDTKNLECTTCSLTFDTLNKYKKHKLCHLENEDHLSAICDDFYEEKCQLECHATARRPEIVENYNYLCNICKCSFPDELLLQSHTSRCHTADEIFINQTISVEHDNNSVKHVHAYNKCNEEFQHRSLQSRSNGYSGNSSMECETCYPLDQRSRAIPVVPDEVKKYEYMCYVCGGLVETKALLDAHLKHCKPGAVNYSCYICKQNPQSRSLLGTRMTYCCDHSSITNVDPSRNLESSEATNLNCANVGRKSSSMVSTVDETQMNHVERGSLSANIKSESEPDLEYRSQTGNAVRSNRPQFVDTEGVACLTNLSQSILMETAFLDVPGYPLSSVNENASAITCEICNEHFTNFECLLQHWDSCFDVDSLKCNICGTTFKSERSLSNHKMNDHANVDDVDPIGNIPCINLETEKAASNDSVEGSEIFATENNNISDQLRAMSETCAVSTTLMEQATASVTLPVREEEKNTSTKRQRSLANEQPTVPAVDTSEPKLIKKRKRRRRITALSKRARALQALNRASVVSKIPMKPNKNQRTVEQQLLVASDETLPDNNNSKVSTSSDSKDGNSSVVYPIASDSVEQDTLSYDFDIQVSDKVTNNTIVETTTYTILYDKADTRKSPSSIRKESLNTFTNNLRIVPVSSDTTFVVPKDHNNIVTKTMNCSTIYQSNNTPDRRPLPSVIDRPQDDTQVHQNETTGMRENDEFTGNGLSPVVDESENKGVTTVSQKSVDLPSEDGTTEEINVIDLGSTAMVEAIRSRVHDSPDEENTEKSSAQVSANRSEYRQVNQNPTVFPNEKTPRLSNISKEKQTPKSFDLGDPKSIQDPHNHCTACGSTFSNNAALMQHLPQHKASSCPKCHLLFFFSDQFLQHNGTRNFCSECRVQLTVPKLGHTWPERYTLPESMTCGLCARTFKTVTDLSEHFKITHMTVSCAICDKVLSSRHLLLSHARTHAKHPIEQLLQCCLCFRYFPSKPHLIAHISERGCGFATDSGTENSGENSSKAVARGKTLLKPN